MTIRVRTTSAAKIFYDSTSIRTAGNQALLIVKRQNKPLKLTVVTNDSSSKQVVIEPMIGTAYWMNFTNFGVGYLFDLMYTKRFAYAKSVYLNLKDKNDTLYIPAEPYRPFQTKTFKTLFGSKGDPDQKGELLFNVSTPFANGFYITPKTKETKSIIGGPGIGAGLDYFYSNTQFLNFTAAIVIDNIHLGKYGPREELRSRYIALSNNHLIGRFTVGYGVAYAHNTWEYFNSRGVSYYNYTHIRSSEGSPSEIQSHNSLGLIFSGRYNIIQNLYIGGFYRPTFIRFNSPESLKYEHVLSFFEVSYKVSLNKAYFKVKKIFN